MLCVAYAGAQGIPDYDAQIQRGNTELQAGSADHALASGETAIRISPERWEGYALAGGALLNLKRYEESADALSKAIERAPQSQQASLRDLRRQGLLAESAVAVSAKQPASAAISPAEIVAPQAAENNARAAGVQAQPAQTQAEREATGLGNAVWVDSTTGVMWARPWYYPANAKKGSWNFADSQTFCAGLRMLGYSNWRLPTVDEVQHIYLVSSKGWLWTRPQFSADYGIDYALKRGIWQPAAFTIAGDTFNGTRLLIWSSTPGDQSGEHAAVYFGKRYSVRDDLNAGVSLKGLTMRNAFQGYALCVRTQ